MENIEELLAQACTAVDAATSTAELEQARVEYLGKKGPADRTAQRLRQTNRRGAPRCRCPHQRSQESSR